MSFLCEVPSCTAVECSIGSTGSICFHPPRKTKAENISISLVQTLLHESKRRVESAYNLVRFRASEFMGFMISDVDRQYREEEMYAVPIAYGLKGYSLLNAVMREMMEHVLLEM